MPKICHLAFKIMLLIVGLGNPGKKYEKTRHNVGARAVDEIAANFQFPIFNFQSISNSKISKGTFKNQDIVLVKPQTYMNNSGQAAKLLIKTYFPNNAAAELKRWFIVIHDDLDLPLGKIRLVKNRGPAGHKGVESIIRELKTENFIRFRIGIQPQSGKPKNPEDFVLQKFNKKEEKIVKEVIQKTVFAIEIVLKEGLEKAMNLYNI